LHLRRHRPCRPRAHGDHRQCLAIVTVGLAVGILSEAFTEWHAAGTALVLFGVWLFGRKATPKRVDVEATEVEP